MTWIGGDIIANRQRTALWPSTAWISACITICSSFLKSLPLPVPLPVPVPLPLPLPVPVPLPLLVLGPLPLPLPVPGPLPFPLPLPLPLPIANPASTCRILCTICC